MTLYAVYLTKDQESFSSTLGTASQALAMEPELSNNTTNPSTAQTSSTMSPHTSLAAIYPTASPPEVTRTSTSPGPGHLGRQLEVGIGGLHNNELELQRDYLSTQPQEDSMWTASVGSQAGSDDFDNYALHSSPAIHGLPLQDRGSGTSPRTNAWSAPEQHVRSVSWDHFPRHNSHIPSFQLRESFLQDPSTMPVPSFPADGLPYTPIHSFDGSEAAGFLLGRSQTEPYQTTTTAATSQYPLPDDGGGVPTPESMRGLSPCSTTLGFKLEEDMLSPSPGSGTIDDLSAAQSTKDSMSGAESHSRLNSTAPSPASGGGAPSSSLSLNGNNKGEEPYAKLIYRAFMSKPSHAMTLQEIYQWFRENTDKGKDDSKGWQNSIRHNLSMNQAFTKRERRSSTSKDENNSTTGTTVEANRGSSSPKIHLTTTATAASSSSTTTAESKKSTEWFLQDWAIAHGVQSTTRYRKGNSCTNGTNPSLSGGLAGRRGTSSPGSSISRNSSASSYTYRSYPHARGTETMFPRRASSSSRGKFHAGGHHHSAMMGTLSGRIRSSSRPGNNALRGNPHIHQQITQHYGHFSSPHPHHHQQQQQQRFYQMLPEQYNPYATAASAAGVGVGVGVFQPHLLETDRLQIGLDYGATTHHHQDFTAATDPALFPSQTQTGRQPSIVTVTEGAGEPAITPEPAQVYYPSTSAATSDLSAYAMPVGVYDGVATGQFRWGTTTTTTTTTPTSTVPTTTRTTITSMEGRGGDGGGVGNGGGAAYQY